ncbi:hypothetical protein AGRO_3824 [Agrobacterium sp. ATCC 31749]|nr:hypothetical protein AGRO_3824 [Agrobacterium sp. ATCC 31749]
MIMHSPVVFSGRDFLLGSAIDLFIHPSYLSQRSAQSIIAAWTAFNRL